MTFQYHSALPGPANLLFALISGAPSLILGIAAYVLMAMALSAVARNRGLKNAWLAWIPVVRVWLLGSISDQYRYVVKGTVRNKRHWLLVLNILKSVLVSAAAGVCVAAFVHAAFAGPAGMEGLVWTAALLSLAACGVSIAYTVVYFMALYDVYTSMDPDLSTLFLLLSIFLPVTEPFFLFFCRNKEIGMPPRRREPWESDNL